MTGILGLAMPTTLLPMLIGAGALALISGAGGAYIDHKLMTGKVASAQLATANLNATYRGYEASVAQTIALDDATALSQQNALTARANDLQAQLQDTQRIADARSKTLNAILSSAKPGDTRLLGPSVLSYVAGLRGP